MYRCASFTLQTIVSVIIVTLVPMQQQKTLHNMFHAYAMAMSRLTDAMSSEQLSLMNKLPHYYQPPTERWST